MYPTDSATLLRDASGDTDEGPNNRIRQSLELIQQSNAALQESADLLIMIRSAACQRSSKSVVFWTLAALATSSAPKAQSSVRSSISFWEEVSWQQGGSGNRTVRAAGFPGSATFVR
jgi:hypothetical protein